MDPQTLSADTRIGPVRLYIIKYDIILLYIIIILMRILTIIIGLLFRFASSAFFERHDQARLQ